jgi:ABC-type phosphate transport system substrate-binding protein
MFARKSRVALGVALAAPALVVGTMSTAAFADPSFTPTPGTDLYSVGSDTTQWVVNDLATAYNSTSPATGKIASFDACKGTGTGINPDGTGFPCATNSTSNGRTYGALFNDPSLDATTAGGAVPAGSGAGRTALYSGAQAKDIAFARSSGPIGGTDVQNGLAGYPFAVDTIVVATHPGGPAPAALTGDQVLKIYQGVYTNWAQVGGASAPIHVYVPKKSSGTRGAFNSFMNGLAGTPAAPDANSTFGIAHDTWGGAGSANPYTGTTPVEEHDPSVVIADVDAIVPFSLGRAKLANAATAGTLGGTTGPRVRVESGWSADRALYNVLRHTANAASGDTTSVANTKWLDSGDASVMKTIFSGGSSSWMCGAAAKTVIEKDGFWQIGGGLCGTSWNNNVDPSNLTGVGKAPATQISAVVASGAANAAHAATIGVNSPSGTPAGTVRLTVFSGSGATSRAVYTSGDVALAGGQAAVTIPANKVPAGAARVAVTYTPSDATQFGTSAFDGRFTVTGATAKPALGTAGNPTPVTGAKFSKIKKSSKKVTVTFSGSVVRAITGTVKVYDGKKLVGTGKVVNGKVVVKLNKKLKKGKHHIKVALAASRTSKAFTKVYTVKVK